MPEKYLILGGSGYVGDAFQNELKRRGSTFVNVSRRDIDYSQFGTLVSLLRDYSPSFVINCAGYTGKPNVDACETARDDTILGNVVLAETIANACESESVPLGHVSSGCIYSGAKIAVQGEFLRVEKDLMKAEIRQRWQADPSVLHGFTEDDAPNFSFSDPPCSFYSGTKALSEKRLSALDSTYLWRLRIPFDQFDNPRNYLTKVQSYPRVYDNVNSLSHRADFAKACVDLWELRADFGIYNVTNPGWVTTRQVVQRLAEKLGVDRVFEFFESDSEFYESAVAPRSNTILDSSKLLAAGVKIRTAEEALDDALESWQPASHFSSPTDKQRERNPSQAPATA